MNTADRINKITEKRNILDAQERAIECEKIKTIGDLANGVRALTPRIKELITVGVALLANNIPFGRVNVWNSDEEFITNGNTHELGFFFQHNKDNSPLLGIGIKGGGCYGHDLAVNAEGEFVINIDPYNYNDYCRKYKRFIKEFDEFENKVYQYVDNL